MKHFATGLVSTVALSCASTQPTASGEFRHFYYEVIGNDVLLSTSSDLGADRCFGATGAPQLVSSLGTALPDPDRPGYGRFEPERVPTPYFGPPAPEGVIMTDRYSVVRGRIVSPWCGTDVFYWIHGFTPLPPPGKG